MRQIIDRFIYLASPRVHNRTMTTHDTQDRGGIVGGALTVALLITLAVQNAMPPMATDMYSAAFPQITVDLATNSTMLGFTLTTFFVGYATGQVLGGAISDQIGRRRPIIAGGIIALVGSMICVFTPSIWVLLVGRVFQGLGGGVASSVARAVLVDVAHGKMLARAMSLIQAIVGFAPMLAPSSAHSSSRMRRGGSSSGRSPASCC